MKSAQRYIVCVLLLILTVFIPQKTFAQNVIYENDFESDAVGSLPANWTVARNLQWGNHSLPCMNGANPAQWQVTDVSGNKKVAIAINGPNCISEIIPTNLVVPDLSNYLYEFDITFVDNPGADRAMIFRYVDGANWYGMKVTSLTGLAFQKVVTPNEYSSQLGGVILSTPFTSTTYSFKYEINNNLINFYINNDLKKSISDQEPILHTGVPGLQASQSIHGPNTTYFDNLKVTDLSAPAPTPTPQPTPTPTPPINVPYYSQNDPEWRDETYDTLDKTIGQVGCALTSVVMVLRHHGVSILPDGSTLTVLSLNDYLTGIEGTFKRFGLLNFASIAQLTNKLNGLNPAIQKLEYSTIATKDLEDVNDYINKDRYPIIMQETTDQSSSGSHFVVANAVEYITATQSAYGVLDPYTASRTSLKIPPTKLSSSRLFQPTNSDFSYIIIDTDDKLFPLLQNSANQKTGTTNGIDILEELPKSFLLTEYPLIDSENPNNTQGSPFWEISYKHPETGEYQLILSATQSGWYNFEIFAHNKEGDNQTAKKTIYINNQHPTIFNISYEKLGDIQNILKVNKISTFNTLRDAIIFSYQSHYLKGRHNKEWLLKMIDIAEKLSKHRVHSGSRYILHSMLHHTKLLKRFHLLNEVGYQLITTELNQLLLQYNKK